MIPVIQELRALIVDEVSMVKPDMIDCMNNALRAVRRDTRPFGGVPVIFVGDMHQLPPVVDNNAPAQFYTHRYRSPYFFEADVFTRENVPLKMVELTRVFRQEDQSFVDTLSLIRVGQEHREAVARINRECHRDRQPPQSYSLHLVTTNAAAWAINREKLDALPATLVRIEGVIEGKFTPGVNRLPAPNPLELKAGAQVIFVKNNRPYWVNGTMGTVVEISGEIIRVQIEGTASTVGVQRVTWEQMESVYDPVERRVKSKVVGTYRQFPLALGWAITIHKAQGMTLQSVRIDMVNGAFSPGQTYVALSRCKTIEGIYLDAPLSMQDVLVDQQIVEFYRRMREG